MNTILEHLTGMHKITDQVIAMDLLVAAKSGVRNYAMGVTETVTPEIKATLTKQLDEALDLYERVSAYMIDKGMYHPWNVNEQLQVDLKAIETAMSVLKV